MKKHIKTSRFLYNSPCHPRNSGPQDSGISTLLKRWMRFPITAFGNDSIVRGFTLVELLVVVLIIGVLSAIAIPMYQGAIDKSRWSTLLAPAKALQTAQTAAFMENGAYAEDMSALVLSLPGEAQDNKYIMPDAEYSIDTKTASQSTITGQLDTLPNVRLSMALKNPDSYLFCEAKSGDARAERLCKNLLAGQKAGSKNGYDKYLLDYPGPCTWANSTGQCYTSEEARCTALGMPYANGVCGYSDWQVSSTTEINEGGVCTATEAGCDYVIVNDGGVCEALSGKGGCYKAVINDGGICKGHGSDDGCYFSIVNKGGICEASGLWGCEGATINTGGICIGEVLSGCRFLKVNGGKCIAKTSGACGGSTYTNGGCCEDYGKGYCPAEHRCN